MQQPRYKRILLKLSGEALMGDTQSVIDAATLSRMIAEVKQLVSLQVEVGIVIGGGNMIRGAAQTGSSLTRITADQMGMLATVINALALRDACQAEGLKASIMSAIPIPGIAEPLDHCRAIRKLAKGQVVLFAGGTGHGLVTTDTTASLRAVEIKADILLKATNVDGIYTADPLKNPQAEKFSQLTFDEALQRQLKVMDSVAFSLCNEHHMPIKVFNIHKPGALFQVVMGEDEGTLVMRSG